MAGGLKFYHDRNLEEFKGYEETAQFCLTINNLFDALNIKSVAKGLTPTSADFKVYLLFNQMLCLAKYLRV